MKTVVTMLSRFEDLATLSHLGGESEDQMQPEASKFESDQDSIVDWPFSLVNAGLIWSRG